MEKKSNLSTIIGEEGLKWLQLVYHLRYVFFKLLTKDNLKFTNITSFILCTYNKLK
jgi:hypothetical protein